MPVHRTISTLVAATGLAASASAQMPVEYWTFDTDFSGGGSSATAGTPVGDGVSVTSVAGEFLKGSGALKIDHTTQDVDPVTGENIGDYLDIPTNSAGVGLFPEFLTNGNAPVAWTVSLWYKFDPTLGPDDDRNFLFETAPDDAVGIGPDTSDGVDEVEWFIGGVTNNNGNGPTDNVNDWNHLVLTYDKASTEVIAFFLNGQPIDVVPIGLAQFFSEGPAQPLDPSVGGDSQDDGLHIGNHRAGDGGRNWQGFIDDFAIFDEAFGPSRAQALFDGTETPMTVLANVPNDLALIIPEFQPVAVEAGWTLEETIPFRGPAGLDYDDASDTLFVGRRFQGDERAIAGDRFNPGENGFDGLYSIDSAGEATQLAGGDNVAGVTIGPDGDVYFCEDFDGEDGDGNIFRYNLATDTQTNVATGFAAGDSDPMNIEFVPAGFDGSAFGLDSVFDPFLEPGDAITVDRGNGGFEEVYIFNPDTNPDAPFVGSDAGALPNFDEILVIDGVGDDGDGIAFNPADNNNPFDNPGDIAIVNGRIFVADEGQDVGGAIWEVVGIDSVVKLPLSEEIMPVALRADTATGTLLAVDRDRNDLGATRVVRIDVSGAEAEGDVTTVIENLGGFPNGGNNSGWGSLAVSDDGMTLFVGDEVSNLGRIYRFTMGAGCNPADLAAPFGVLDLADADAFIAAFVGGDSAADLAPPAGIIDLADVDAFIAAFLGGCP